jgi:hypothetical protein
MAKTGTSRIDVGAGPALELSAPAYRFLQDEVAAGRALIVDGRLYVPFGPGRAVPAMVQYAGSSGRFAWRLWALWDGTKHRCTSLELQAWKGEHISAEALRAIPLGTLVEEALLCTAIELDESGGPAGLIVEGDVSLAQARKLHEKVLREHRRRLRGTRQSGAVTDDKLKETAAIYRANLNSRPVYAVADQFKIARSTAGRWVGLARKKGFLEPALGRGRAGITLDNTRGQRDG